MFVFKENISTLIFLFRFRFRFTPFWITFAFHLTFAFQSIVLLLPMQSTGTVVCRLLPVTFFLAQKQGPKLNTEVCQARYEQQSLYCKPRWFLHLRSERSKLCLWLLQTKVKEELMFWFYSNKNTNSTLSQAINKGRIAIITLTSFSLSSKAKWKQHFLTRLSLAQLSQSR